MKTFSAIFCGKRKFALLVGLLGTIATAAAGDFYLKPNATDWSVATSYYRDTQRTETASTVPGAEDTIFVPAGVYALTAGTDSFTVFANALRIAPEETNSVIELNVPDGDAANPHVIKAMIYHDTILDADRGVGVIVKKGAGFLYLTAKNGIVNNNGSHIEYGVNFDVREGTLRFPVDETNSPLCGFLKVASGAAVWMAQSDENATQMHFDYIEAEEGSLLTNATTRSSGHVIGLYACGATYSHTSYIKGALGGGIRIWTAGSIRLETTQNTSAGVVTISDNYGAFASEKPSQCRGTLYVTQFGNPGEASSLGTGNECIIGFGSGGGGVRYIGAGNETTARNYSFYSTVQFNANTSAYPAFIDAGETGGITFTGAFQPRTDGNTPPAVRRLFLMGENTNECVVAGGFLRLTSGEITYPTYVTKAGTGTWRFADNASRYHVGGTAITDGTLKFDSIAEKGSMCALGLSTILTPDDSRAVAREDFVSYAFALGDAAGTGQPVFEYTGKAAATCSTRPLVLVGAGGTIKASQGALDFSGISARDANTTPTLILDGAGTDNVVREISNGVATAAVSVTKKGSGTWTLDGNLTMSGDVRAEAGTLRVNVPRPIAWPERAYKWFRLSIAQICTNGATQTSLLIRQIGLFDKDGVRQNAYLTQPVTVTAGDNVITEQTLAPGQVWLDARVTGYTVNTQYADFLAECFRENDGYNGDYGRLYISLKKGSTVIKPTPSDSSTWIPIVMRLADTANPITHFDIQGFANTMSGYPTRFQLEGSADGKEWTTVWSNVAGDELASSNAKYNRWVSDGTDAANNKKARPFGTGLNTSTQSGKVYDHFNWYRLSIARIGNATTPINRLSIRQIGLYNSAGRRLNEGLKLAETPGKYNVVHEILGTVPAEGEVGYGSSAIGLKMKNTSTNGGQEIQDCFDGFYNGNTGGMCSFSWFTASGTDLAPIPSDATTWIPIVMHLPAGTDPVSHFDIENYDKSDATMPSRVMLEGSTNGVNWYVIYNNATQGEPFTPTITTYNQWVSDGVSASADSHERPLGKGFTVTGSHPTDPEPKDQFAHVASVAVASGAVLTTTDPLPVSGLKVNTLGAGTLDGFAFATAGTLDISGEGALSPLPGTYTNCTGLENIANWTLTRDGKKVYRARIQVRDGAIYVTPAGLVISIR